MMQAVQDIKIDMLADVVGTPCMFGAYQTLRYSSVACGGEHTRFDAENPATLLPVDASIVGFFVDASGNTFVYTDGLYTAKLEYSLRGILPPDSVVYAFVFRNAQGLAQLGIFDASQVHGRCIAHLPCIERFKAIHGGFRKPVQTAGGANVPVVYLHWVGHEEVLVRMMKFRKQTPLKIDFAVDCVMRLSDSLLASSTCCKLLTQDPIECEVPVLSTVKMYARLHKRAP
jgi:hypothetical protein